MNMRKIQQGRRKVKRRDAVAVVALGCATLVVACVIYIFNMHLPTSLFFIPPFSSSSAHIKEIRTSDPLPVPPMINPNSPSIRCDRSHHEYDFCTVEGRVTLDQTKPVFVVESPGKKFSEEKLRPYPRKWEYVTMSHIREVTLATSPEVQPCQVQHDAPALVFSAGGYTGNFFHDFNDRFIPLFVTVNNVYGGSDDIILVISNAKEWWMQKFGDVLSAFSKHPVIDLDNRNTSHCFPAVSVGLMSHGFMTIDPEKVSNGKNFSHFRTFLATAFGSSVSYEHMERDQLGQLTRPRLVLATRSGSGGRVIQNQNELKITATEEGFEVIEFKPTRDAPLKQSFDLFHSSHALIGVHGAALTHMLFLRPGSSFVQIVPIGTDWVSKICFGKPAKEIGLDCVQYDVFVNESSLLEKYGTEHPLIRDPVGSRGGWKTVVMDIYLKEQNVKLDLNRFRHYLKTIYSKTSLNQ